MNNNKINGKFLSAYISLDKAAAKKLDTKSGVTEYINKLTNMRFAPGRDEILPRLIKYRKIRNRIAHEPGAMSEINDLSQKDISWLKKLEKNILRVSDPVSKYLRAAGRRERRRALVRTLILAGISSAVILIIAALIILI